MRYGDTLMRDAKSMGLRCNQFVSNVRFLDPPAEGPKQVRYAKPDLKAGPLCLTFAAGFPAEAKASSGVRISLLAGRRGTKDLATLFETNVKPGPQWRAYAVNLSRYAGAKALLRFVVDPGIDARYDWFQWGEPKIVRLTDDGQKTILSNEAIYEQAQKGVIGWPYGDLGPLRNGAVARLHAGADPNGWLAVGDVRKPGVFLHPAWKGGHCRPVYLQWTLDLKGKAAPQG